MKENRTILITGASSDVARATIDVIAPRFEHIYAHYSRSKDSIDQLVREFGTKIIPLQADFSDESSLQKMITEIQSSEFQPDSILHLPAAPYRSVQFRKLNWSNFQSALDIQVRSLMELAGTFLPGMSKDRFGRIVVLLSSVTINTPPKFLSDYVSAKYALLGLSKALAAEYAEKGVTFNCISPEMMETKMLRDVPELLIEQNAASSPMGRNARPSDLVPLISWLLSEECAYTTGQNFAIMGGK